MNPVDGIIEDNNAPETPDRASKRKILNFSSDKSGTEEKHDKYPMTVLSVTTVGALLASVQGSALLIVLPDMMMAMKMPFMTTLWVLLIFLMVTTIMVPILGRIADMFGRKRIYVLGFAVFTLGSLLCGLCGPDYLNLSFNGWGLVAFRIVQALGASMLLANSTAMITDAFKKGRLGFAIGVNQVAASAGFVIGPVIGGLLAPLGWEWIFLFNVPIGIFGTIWAAHRLREPKWEIKKQKFDWLGAVTFFIGLFGILVALTYVSFGDPDLMYIVYIMAVVGAIGLAAFLFIELRVAEHPMMNLRLFRGRNYAIGNLTNMLNGLYIGAATFLLIFYFQGPCHMTALQAGIILIASGLPIMIVGPLSGRLSDKIGPKLLIVGGLAMGMIALAGFSFVGANTPTWYMVIFMVCMGIGGGLFMSPNASSVMTSVPPEHRGIASGTRIMLRNTGSMFSLAIAFPLVLTGLDFNDMVNIFLGEGAVSDAAITKLLSGLGEAFTLFAIIAAVAVCIALMRGKDKTA